MDTYNYPSANLPEISVPENGYMIYPDAGYQEGYRGSPVSDRPRLIRILIVFSFALAGDISSALYGNWIFAIVGFVITMLFALLILRAWEMILLTCFLMMINGLHVWIDTSLNIFNEPFGYKALKDIIVLGLILAKIKCTKERWQVSPPLLLTFFPWALYAIAHAVINPGVIPLTGVQLRYVVVFICLVFFISSALDNERKVDALFRVFCSAAVMLILLGFYELITNRQTYTSGYVSYGPITQRMVSAVGSPNGLGLFLQFPFLYLISRRFMLTRFQRKWWEFPVLLLIIAGMLVTFSRSAILFGGVGVIVIAASARNFRAVFIVAIIGTMFPILFNIMLSARGPMAALGGRPEALVHFFGKSLEEGSLLFGNGWGSGIVVTFERVSGEVTDNFQMDLIRKVGIVGLFFWEAIIVEVFIRGFRGRRDMISPTGKQMYAMLLALYIVFICYSFVSPVFNLAIGSLFYWILMGVWMNLSQMEQIENQLQYNYMIPAE
ncbi:MAG: hypothetical protein WCE45_04370 [Sedimentisphaerales bacterium]